MRKIFFASGIVAIAMLVSGAALAAKPEKAASKPAATEQGSISLKSVTQQVKVSTDAKGVQHTTLVPAGKVLPGTEVVYSFEYVNVGKQPTSDVVITDAVPEHMVYVPDTAEGKGMDIMYSIDGGKTWGNPDQLSVRDADGTTHTALPKDYNAIRWVLKGSLAAGGKGSVSYHAVLQ